MKIERGQKWASIQTGAYVWIVSVSKFYIGDNSEDAVIYRNSNKFLGVFVRRKDEFLDRFTLVEEKWHL